MTVQDLIDDLMKIEDKDQEIGASFGTDYFSFEISIRDRGDHVELC